MIAGSGMAFVTSTERPKSLKNRCVIEVFGGIFYGFSVGLGNHIGMKKQELFCFLFGFPFDVDKRNIFVNMKLHSVCKFLILQITCIYFVFCFVLIVCLGKCDCGF